MDAVRPYISFVVTSRNDDHGGSLLRRMQTFTNALIAQSKRFDLPCELIIVEWNPLPERCGLIDALQWPDDLGPCQVRFIEVPEELHLRHRHSKELPLFQMIAKNVGIRRARGEYVCATNIDILLNDELMQYLADRKLQSGKMYRLDRHDAETFVPVDGPVQGQLDYCSKHLIRVNAREGTFPVTPTGTRIPFEHDIVSKGSNINLGTGWYQPEYWDESPFRWCSKTAELKVKATNTPYTAIAVKIDPISLPESDPCEISVEDAVGNEILRGRFKGKQTIHLNLPVSTHEERTFFLKLNNKVGPFGVDPRPLGARIYGINWSELSPSIVHTSGSPNFLVEPWYHIIPNEVTPPEMGISFGNGWYDVEIDATTSKRIRWMENDGFLSFPKPPESADFINLWVEPGPGVHWGPCQMELRNHLGEVLQTFSLRAGQQIVSVDLRSDRGRFRFLTLHVVGGGATIPSDPRVMNLRIWGIEWAAEAWDLSQPPPTPQPVSVPASIPLQIMVKPTNVQRVKRKVRRAASQAKRLAKRIVPNQVKRLFGRGPLANPVSPVLETPNPIAPVEVTPNFTEIERPRQDLPIPGRDNLDATTTNTAQAQVEKPAQPAQPLAPPAFPDLTVQSPVFLHTNACGDFTMMAMQHWLDIRGYPEFEIFSMNIDSLGCYMAHHAGAVEEVLPEPMRIYHIEHGAGSGWTPEGASTLLERIAKKGIRYLNHPDVMTWAREMARMDAPLIFNREEWGMGSDRLKETFVSSQSTSARRAA